MLRGVDALPDLDEIKTLAGIGMVQIWRLADRVTA
jgi:hypothetical protein